MKNDEVYYYTIYGDVENPITTTVGSCDKYENIAATINSAKNADIAPQGTKVFYAQVSRESYDIFSEMFALLEHNPYVKYRFSFMLNGFNKLITSRSISMKDVDESLSALLIMLKTFAIYEPNVNAMDKESIIKVVKDGLNSIIQ
jgi:hypothetical protein